MKSVFSNALIIVFVVIFTIPSLSIARQWYESESFERSDPFGLGSYHSASGPSNNNRIMGTYRIGSSNPARGFVYIRLKRIEFNEISQASPPGFLHYENVLDTKEAKFWNNFFKYKSSNEGVPLIISLATNFSNFGYFIDTFVNSGMLLLDAALKEYGNTIISNSAFAEIIAKGGRFREYSRIVKDSDGHPFLHNDVYYQITVGEEERFYPIYSSRYAVKIE